MPDIIKVFVSYGHQDSEYLEKDSLLDYLKGLEKEQVSFWTDREIRAGECWDEVIKTNIQDANIALVLVSQGFLDSDYCQKQEIESFLAQKTHLIPIILSPCEWQRHAWLSRRQFLPGGDQTIEEHYTEPGRRKRLFLEIRQQLRERVKRIRENPQPELKRQTSPIVSNAKVEYSGGVKIEFCRRLGNSWQDLADHFPIPDYDQARFEHGDAGRGIWAWLENRRRLGELPAALTAIGRQDLANLFKNHVKGALIHVLFRF